MALTPDELRQRIANWSLESDGQLLQYMVSIAKNIEDKCSKTRDNLNSLMLQVNQTEVKLATATNQFSAVEQVKFVENRVEEDDESFYGLRRRRQQVDEPRKDTQQEDGDERTMDDLIQLAVERSIEGMYKSYEKVTLQLTDSESSDDDDLPTSTRLTDPAELTAGKATIMRAVPKYSFIERPLPHVIGSKEWQNKWHVGLIDSEDESSSDRKEEYSESPSETDDGGMFPSQPNSKNHTPSESESSIWGAEGRKRAPSMDPSVTGDDGSSVYSYASSSKVPRPLPVVAARGISSEGARLKPPSLFPEEPPEEDVRRRGERGLFDDSPEEDEPTPIPTPQPRQAVPTMNDTTKSFFKGNAQQPARKIVNLFDDEPPEPLPDSLPVPEQKKTINLFIESEDDEEQVKENVRNNNVTSATEKRRVEEVTAKQSLKPAGPALTNPRAMTKLVDELNNNFRRQQGQPAPEKTKPVPEDNSRARSSVTNIFDDEPPIDDFDRLFIAANPTAKPAVRQTILPQPTARVEKEKKPINLFAEDDEDDYDGIVVGSNETRPQKSPSQGSYISPGRSMLTKPAERLPTVKKKSIFDESDSEEGTNDADSDLFGSTTKKAPTVMPPVQIPKAAPKVTKSIFSDSSEAEDDDDEALFGKSSSILKNKLDALKKNGGAAGQQEVGSTSKPESKPVSKSKSLFDEDSEEDAQDVKKDDDLFGSVSKSAASLVLDKKTVNPAPKVSLFDDEPPSDDDDALFGQNRRKVETQPSSVEATQKEGISSNASESGGPIATNSIVDLFTKTEPSASVPKQSLKNSEQLNSQPAVKENPVESNNSIRSLILKKSIFNSDSESEEDDSIFGAVGKSSEKPNVSTAEPKVSVEVEKSELNHDKETPRQTNDDAPTIEEKQSIEKGAIVVEEPKSNVNENGDNSIAQNTLESVNHVDKNEPSSIQNVLRAPVDDTVQIPVDPKTSIFDSSTSENEADHDSGDSITHQISELTAQSKASEENISFVPTLEPSVNDNVFQEENASLPAAKVEETSGTSETPHTKLPEPDEGTLSDETPNGMMIANDIDYYLHTNEPSKDGSEKLASKATPAMDRPPAPVTPPAAKSEPKSALNFSPIGLFDDVPPPDDGDETDDVTHPKQSASVESTLPPIMDEASSYSQESQSLDFIPSGSAGGNRSRYLFDDEPPPDEADDSSANPSFAKPSAFKVGSAVVKGLFDNPAPASLPPMVEDSRSESSKPIRPKVNKLNAKLAINVAALLPGARRPMPASSSPEKQLASTVTSVSKDTPETTAKPAQSEEAPNSGKLTGLNKGRARIPTKRKPPSRQTLRAGSLGSSLQSSVSEEERNEKDPPQSSAADDRIVVGSEGKVEHVEAGLPPQDSFPPANHTTVSSKVEIKRTEDPFVDRLSASVRNPSKRVVLPDGNDGDKPSVTATAKKTTVKTSKTSLFGDSDGEGDDDDFFSTLPTKGVVIKKEATKRAGQPKPVAAGSRSIFGSDDEDEADGGEDDLFGTKKSSIAGQLKAKVLDVSASQAAGARKEKKSLFDDDDDDGDDDDDIFGSKSKTISKVNSHQHQANPVGRSSLSTVTKPMTTTTSPADDPLADLLADS
ncbi:WASH complex subunit 2 isoform X2 [Anopheles merus]|uniref:WASH complex subunit 2 isoform X2 n=1 Tax=Anopheles merus TaxID=30066 RepID=UPI001BE4D392|nr:WASH complex subunit 2 isoform X2 [Anopheles merus]